MQLPKVSIAIDDADPIEAQCTSRDLLAMEKDGIDINTMSSMAGGYTMAWYALKRLHRQGKTTVDPGTLEEFMDSADINVDDEADPEGNGSAPVATTGS